MHDASSFGVWWTNVLTDIVHSQLIQHLFCPWYLGTDFKSKSLTLESQRSPVASFTTSVLPVFEPAKLVEHNQLAKICVPATFKTVLG